MSRNRVYASWYSKQHLMTLDGECVAKKSRGSRLLFRPFKANIGEWWVPAELFKQIVVVNDAGLIEAFSHGTKQVLDF